MQQTALTTSVPSRLEVEFAVRSLLAGPTFSHSPQLSSFLQYVTNVTLAGNSSRIKAYTIGVDALGRRDDFDPDADAIVRVSAGRIRRGLLKYYANEGANTLIIIDLPLQHYIPTFSHRIASGTKSTTVSSHRRGLISTIDWMYSFLKRAKLKLVQ
jgi:hypothetical protein